VRILYAISLVFACVLAASPAEADEVFVLDNGYTVRGFVVREDAERVVVRLAGFAEENRITLQPSEIKRRYKNVPPKPLRRTLDEDFEPPIGDVKLGLSSGPPRTVQYTDLPPAPRDDLGRSATRGLSGRVPDTNPSLRSESYFGRLYRVSILALPPSLEGRLLLGVLLLTVLSVMVAGGTRLLGMRAPSMHASTTLGLLLGIFLVGDIFLSSEVLRADRALWLLPLQAVIWLGAARATLDAPLARTIPLFALVLFASTCFVFATGSLLVSV